jgi:hypothetical protein
MGYRLLLEIGGGIGQNLLAGCMTAVYGYNYTWMALGIGPAWRMVLRLGLYYYET